MKTKVQDVMTHEVVTASSTAIGSSAPRRRARWHAS
jgi:hypothetical protein